MPTDDYLMESKDGFGLKKSWYTFSVKKNLKSRVIIYLDKKTMCHMYMTSFFIAKPTQGMIPRSANSKKI